jgi:hypothetical protein
MDSTQPIKKDSPKSSARHMNNHNVYVVAGEATEQQLIDSTKIFKKQLCEMFPDKGYDKCEIIVNLVTDKDGNSFRHAYVWVSNIEVYYIMTGHNIDGTERFIIKDEETKEEPEEINFDDMDWSDMMSEEIKKESKVKIKEELPPILSLPGYEYTPAQYERVKETLRSEAVANNKPFDETSVPKFGYFAASRARAGNVSSEYNSCILRSIVPIWVTKEMIKSVFDRYSTSKNTGKDGQLSPKVSSSKFIKKDYNTGKTSEDKTQYVVLVEFDFNDAIFALQMSRKVKFINPVTKEEKITIWNFLKKFDGEKPRSPMSTESYHSKEKKDYKPKHEIKREEPKSEDFRQFPSSTNRAIVRSDADDEGFQFQRRRR